MLIQVRYHFGYWIVSKFTWRNVTEHGYFHVESG